MRISRLMASTGSSTKHVTSTEVRFNVSSKNPLSNPLPVTDITNEDDRLWRRQFVTVYCESSDEWARRSPYYSLVWCPISRSTRENMCSAHHTRPRMAFQNFQSTSSYGRIRSCCEYQHIPTDVTHDKLSKVSEHNGRMRSWVRHADGRLQTRRLWPRQASETGTFDGWSKLPLLLQS